MKIGLVLADPLRAVAEARAAEAAGYDYLASGEHVFFHAATSNALALLAAAAGATERVRLVSSVALLPLYPPALLAKLAATLDQVSGGRFELGVGAGGEYPAEFAACGVDPASRFRRLDEGLAVLRALFTGEPVTFHGEFASLDGLALQPPPVQPGGPPIWLPGRKEGGLRRVGRFADVWVPYMVDPGRLRAGLARVREHAVDAGRAASAVSAALFVWACVDGDGDWARRTGVDVVSATYDQDFAPLAGRYLLLGDPDTAVARLREFADAGAETVLIQVAAHGADRERVVRTVSEQVLPAVAEFVASAG